MTTVLTGTTDEATKNSERCGRDDATANELAMSPERFSAASNERLAGEEIGGEEQEFR
jgi:hypothetical protein